MSAWPRCGAWFFADHAAMEAQAWRECSRRRWHDLIRRTPHRGALVVLPPDATPADLADATEHREPVPGKHRTG